MFNKILKFLNFHIKNYLSDKTIEIIQRKLIGADIYIKSEDFISSIIIIMFLVSITLIILFIILNIPITFAILITIIIPLLFIGYVYYKNEKRLESIELDLPDYLRQLSSLVKVGYGVETAFNELSKTINNPLNDEIKRALLETSFGKPFNDSLMAIAQRVKSDNLKHTFQIIIYSKESGGNISDILDSIADDLTDTIMLKKERKANVMMSVMFLLISSVIATPFALGMVRLYSDFIGQLGRNNPLAEVIPTASMGYVIIQSILVSILIGIVMYSDAKKGIEFAVLLLPLSIIIYSISQILFKGILGV